MMFNNNRGQAILVGIMMAVLAFVAVISMIGALKDSIITARSPANLDCGNSSISTGQSATCIVTDYYLFAFVISGMGAGLAYITGISLYNRLQR